jgi:hypothetical protein
MNIRLHRWNPFNWNRLVSFLAPTFYGGGGGGPQQSTSTVTQSSIPDWLKPQTEAMLGEATKQIFQTTPGENGSLDITGVKGYTPYSTNASDYFANFSPLQQQSFSNVANLQTPGQYGIASNMVTGAGMGGLMAGQQYGNAVTNPGIVQNYMSPYQQGVTDVAKAGALRDYQIGQTFRQANAARSGAFGGGRQAIENAEAQRNLNQQLQNLDVQGQQSAYNAAMQNIGKQADLGIQGLGVAGQAGSALSNIGTANLGAQQSIINAQNQMGQQQQQYNQNIINQQIQDYANTQQYPMQQLAMYNALLRGYAVPTSAQTTYQTPPSAMSQFGGLAATGLGAYMASKKEGGRIEEPKTYKSGGLVDLAIANVMGEA